MLGFLCEFGDEAGTDAVKAGEETAPGMLAAPEVFTSFWIDDGEIGVTGRRSLVVVGNLVLGDVAVFVDRTGLSTCEEDIAAFVRVGGEKEDKVGFLGIRHQLELAPLLELRQRVIADRIRPGLVEEADLLGIEDPRRLRKLLLLEEWRGARDSDRNEKGEARHDISAVLGRGITWREKRLDSGVYNLADA